MLEESSRPAGYTHLYWLHRLDPDTLRRQCWIRDDGRARERHREGEQLIETFPAKYHPGDDEFDHLIFALKYDGVDLLALTRIFRHVDQKMLAARIKAEPTSQYGRRLFFLFEFLSGSRLDIQDLSRGNYCPVLDPEEYFTAAGRQVRRHRVVDNLLGNREFCPTVRRSADLVAMTSQRLDLRAAKIMDSADPSLLARATRYLYTKETKSSFAIEHEEPGDRMDRFVEQLSIIGDLSLDTESGLTELQNSLVDLRFVESGYRGPGSEEVYVGQSVGLKERVHHVGTKSEAVPNLMVGWARQREVMGEGGAVVEAACRSFSFVFIHPFGDGNGRIHRLLLHHVLARRGYLPGDLVVPISSVILNDMGRYDDVLEDFSRRVVRQGEVRYELDEQGRLTIDEPRLELYRYPDLTAQAEVTFVWLERAIEVDLLQELEYLRTFDLAREELRSVIEMPDRLERLFIKLCLQNQGRLTKSKRRFFEMVDDETIAQMEAVVAATMQEREQPA